MAHIDSAVADNIRARFIIRVAKLNCPARRKASTLDNSLPASELLQSLQKLTNIVYLTKLCAGDKLKVRNYMTEAEGELARLKDFVAKLGPSNSHEPIN